jgi:hypothetical protein
LKTLVGNVPLDRPTIGLQAHSQSWLLFTFFIFSRKERLIGVIDGMTQKEIFGEIKRKGILMFKIKEN